MKIKKEKKRIQLSRVVLPLLLSTIKRPEVKMSSLFKEVNNSVNKIISSLEHEIEIKEEYFDSIKNELLEIMSINASYEVIYNKNEYLDDVTENIIEFLSSQKEIDINNNSENNNLIYYSMINIFSEINRFHSLLYFSGYINFENVKELNNNTLINCNKIINGLVEYLKNNDFNDKDYIYDIIKIATIIYADILEGLFLNLSKNEQKMKEYLNNQKSYIYQIENLFIEQYSLLNTCCNNIINKLEI